MMSKSQFVESLATRLGISKSEASKYVDHYAAAVAEALRTDGEVKLPGLVKIRLKDIPARPAGQRMNPFTKQMVDVAEKPASKKVKVIPMSALKKAVI
jgi:nucleoid DNA-binding protein